MFFHKKKGLTVEFKSSFTDAVVESLVAFSNAKGGTVYIGISDNGSEKGGYWQIESA